MARCASFALLAPAPPHGRAANARPARLDKDDLAWHYSNYYNGGDFEAFLASNFARLKGRAPQERPCEEEWPSASLRRCYGAPAA